MEPPFALIANVKSGRRNRDRLDHLRKTLGRVLGAPVAYHAVRGGRGFDAAFAALRGQRAGTVFVAGGDGTISATAQGLRDSGHVLAPLPGGTFNFFVRGLGIPEDIDAAITALAAGRVVRVPVGEVNGRLFLNNASIGLYPAILAAREGIYRSWGRSRVAAYWSVLRTLLRSDHRMHLALDIDGARRELVTPMLFAAINRYQLDQYRLDGAEALDHGYLALFAGRDVSRLARLAGAVRLGLGRARADAEFELLAGREVTVAAPGRRLTVAFDGERRKMELPLALRLRPDALRVLVPQPGAGTG